VAALLGQRGDRFLDLVRQIEQPRIDGARRSLRALVLELGEGVEQALRRIEDDGGARARRRADLRFKRGVVAERGIGRRHTFGGDQEGEGEFAEAADILTHQAIDEGPGRLALERRIAQREICRIGAEPSRLQRWQFRPLLQHEPAQFDDLARRRARLLRQCRRDHQSRQHGACDKLRHFAPLA